MQIPIFRIEKVNHDSHVFTDLEDSLRMCCMLSLRKYFADFLRDFDTVNISFSLKIAYLATGVCTGFKLGWDLYIFSHADTTNFSDLGGAL